jgi:DNA-binding transcriptional ArsR family regulator
MDALGDATRRRIFERLAEGPASVGTLADGMPISRPAVSQHLRVLKDAGLVSDRQVGTRRIYAVDPAGVGVLREYWDRFWSRALDGFRVAAEDLANRRESGKQRRERNDGEGS